MKVAICISGQPRNFRKSFESLKKNYIDRYDCDIFYHTWEDSQFNSTNFGSGSIKYTMSENDYLDLVKIYNPVVFKTDRPIVFDDNNIICPIWRFPLNSILSMAYSAYRSFELCKLHNKNYDVVIRSRFDLNYDKISINLDKIDLNMIHVPKWYTDERVRHRGYNDILMIGNYRNMETLSKLFSKIFYYIASDDDFSQFLSGGWPGQDSPIRTEYLIKWHLIKNKIPTCEFELHDNCSTSPIIR